MDIGYVWDEHKYDRVQEKHDVRFVEVVDVFEDARALHGPDPGGNPNRRMVVGKTPGGRVLQVIYTDEDAPLARIITAFEASQEWRDEYFN